MTTVINFVIMACVIFMIVRQAVKAMPPAAAAGPSEVDLLTETRDSLKNSRASDAHFTLIAEALYRICRVRPAMVINCGV